MAKATKTPATDEKPKCPITREEFAKGAPVVMIDVGDGSHSMGKLLAPPREFSTGSFGWFANEKIVANIGGKLVKVQAQVTFTVVGSKDAAK